MRWMPKKVDGGTDEKEPFGSDDSSFGLQAWGTSMLDIGVTVGVTHLSDRHSKAVSFSWQPFTSKCRSS